MKQKTITTGVCELLLVELPEGAKNIRIETNQLIIPYPKMILYEIPATEESYEYEETEGFDLPQGNWKLLGRLPDITEEQASKVVVKSIHTGLYAHYVNGIPVNTYCYKESLDSLYSLIQANEVYFENKETNPQKYNEALESEGIINGWEKKRYNELRQNLAKIPTFKQQMKIWHEAQSKVWDKERTYLFKKVD